MMDSSVIVAGLPGSGKTTLLAALWHVLNERGGVATALKLKELGRGNLQHLNKIAALWRDAKQQDRTAIGGNKVVSMSLHNGADVDARVTFPDTAGEAFSGMWEDRDLDTDVADTLRVGNVALLINSDTVRAPKWIVDERALLQKMGLAVPPLGQPIPWHPALAPTQVPLVELLQFLQADPLRSGPRKLALLLAVWDKVRDEGLSPDEFLRQKLPLLAQYLDTNQDLWQTRVYGLSAQGGDYDDPKKPNEKCAEAEELRRLNRPSQRIELVLGTGSGHDLTEPFSWLIK